MLRRSLTTLGLVMSMAALLTGCQPPEHAPKSPTGTVATPSPTAAVTLPHLVIYLAKQQGEQGTTQACVRDWPTTQAQPLSDREKVQAAVQALLAGPTAAERKRGLYTEIPPETKLLGISQEGKQLWVNVSSAFTEGGGATSMVLRLNQLTRTLSGLGTHPAISLKVAGSAVDELGGEGVIVNEPLVPGRH